MKKLHRYSLPYEVRGITVTSTGDLAIVEEGGTRAAIVTTRGELIRNLNVIGASELVGISRKGDILFITDYITKNIHVITVSNFYIVTCIPA